MKKLDKLILKSFLGPFILTFFVVVFILLTQFLLKYFDDFVGKDLGWQVFSELIFYFSISMTPVALPLAVLLSSLITFGNLGEHFELTAIKSAGISLLRALLPIFVFVVLLCIGAFYSNNLIVPKANLKAYSLLYDMRQKKPSLDLKEGVFYNGIPGYSIKVNKKFDDGVSLKDVIIYDHSKNMGNTDVIFADSGKMYTIMNERYMLLELFNGYSYSESEPIGARADRYRKKDISQFARTGFEKSKHVFDLSSFDMKRTREELFSSNRLMKNLAQLEHDLDSMSKDLEFVKLDLYKSVPRYFNFHLKDKLDAPEWLVDMRNENSNFHKDYYSDYYSLPEAESITAAVIPDTVKEVSKGAELAIDSLAKPESLPEIVSTKMMAPEAEATKAAQFANPDQQPPLVSREAPLTPKISGKDFKKPFNLNVIDDKEVSAKGKSESRLKKMGMIKPQVLPALDSLVIDKEILTDSLAIARVDSVMLSSYNISKVLSHSTGQARFVKNNISVQVSKIENVMKEYYVNDVERVKKYSMAVSCLIMFLIGAPLGAIIKKGGLGIPVIISILFFIIFYVTMIMGEKYAKEAIWPVRIGVWAPNALLLPFGLFFLRQARKDARLLEADFYHVFFSKLKRRFTKKKKTIS
jgi:lipopolysaccharide export system permease protein